MLHTNWKKLSVAGLLLPVFWRSWLFWYNLLFTGCAGSSLLWGLFSSWDEQGLLLVVVLGLFTEAASLAAAHRLQSVQALTVVVPGLQSTGSTIMVCGLSCSALGNRTPNQGSNPSLWHWQMDSLPLSHQGSSWNSLHSLSSIIFTHLISTQS